MRRFSLVSTLCLAASLSSMVACAANSDVEEDSESGESDLKKKIKPTGGNGAFELVKPTWSTTGAIGQYAFDNRDIAIASRTEKVPGTYLLQTRSNGFDGNQTMGQTFDSIVIKAGAVVPRTVTGLRVRYDQPLTLGGSQYAMQPLPSGSLGYLAPTGSWAKRAEGAFMLVAPGKVKITNAVDAAPTELTLDEGKLNEVVLPTAKASVQVDAYDAAYPTPTSCSAPVLVSGGQSTPVRDQAGNAIPTAVIPHGARATAAVQAYGMSKSIPTAAGQTHSFLLNRLEVDDVEVNAAGGGTQYVKGVFNVEYKDAGGVYRPLVCGNFATHTGIDLLDGSYRVTSRANSPSGVVTHVEEISFP